jgi:hypothetical protein
MKMKTKRNKNKNMKMTIIKNTNTVTTNQEHTSKITTSNMKRMIMTMKMVVTKNT